MKEGEKYSGRIFAMGPFTKRQPYRIQLKQMF